jgi:hypothetical protein
MAKTVSTKPTTPEEKVWTVAEAVANLFELAPSGKTVLFDPAPLASTVSAIEVKQILDRMEQDEKVLELKYSPIGNEFGMVVLRENGECYEIAVPDHSRFREFLNKAHSQHYGDINRLAAENFLAVADVAMDIFAELQLTSGNEVQIPLLRNIVRFAALFPGDGANMRDAYCDYRWKALAYLHERGHIRAFELEEDIYAHRWENKVRVNVDRYDFDKFYGKLVDVYERRIVEPQKKKEKPAPKPRETTPIPSSEVSSELPSTLEVAVKDRQIWVNDFLLSKPHAVGGNKGFFDYLFENAGVSLVRNGMPEYAKAEVGSKNFSKVLNELGFKGEILKAFFPERGKSTVLFRKTVSVAQLEREGIKLPLLLQELRTANIRNSP